MKEQRSAWETALKWLERADRSEAELSNYLASKGYSEAEVHEVLLKVKNFNYLNDHKLKARLEDALTGQLVGPLKIQEHLINRGLDADLCSPPGSHQALLLLKKKYTSIQLSQNPKDVARAARFLAAKGYTEEDIEQAIQAFFTQIDW
jgi:SOS response regulatory protein OraA/RecX